MRNPGEQVLLMFLQHFFHAGFIEPTSGLAALFSPTQPRAAPFSIEREKCLIYCKIVTGRPIEKRKRAVGCNFTINYNITVSGAPFWTRCAVRFPISVS